MANRFWNFVTTFTSGTLAKAEDVNTNFNGVESGLTAIEGEVDQCIKVTNSPGGVSVTLNAAARAGMVVSFDSNGDIIAATELGEWKGNHAAAAGTDYAERDLAKDSTGSIGLNNIYRCNTAHTSTGTLADDTANWDKVIDVADVEAAKDAAITAKNEAVVAQSASEDAQSYSEEWANKVEDSLVSVAAGGNGVDEYSSLHHAAKAAASAAAFFPSGTLMLFQQTAAPTGWTKQTTHNDKSLRVVSGTVSSGGATAFSSVMGSSKTTGSHALSITEMPAHNHGGGSHGHFVSDRSGVNDPANGSQLNTGNTGGNQTSVSGEIIDSQGGNTGHSHTLSLDLQYVDIIIASKD